MIINMNILFYLFVVMINKNTYYNKNLEDGLGMDERFFINDDGVSEEEIIENFCKKELLDKLTNNNYNNDEKIKMIHNWTDLEEKLDIEPISRFKMKKGGLMNDWNFEQF